MEEAVRQRFRERGGQAVPTGAMAVKAPMLRGRERLGHAVRTRQSPELKRKKDDIHSQATGSGPDRNAKSSCLETQEE